MSNHETNNAMEIVTDDFNIEVDEEPKKWPNELTKEFFNTSTINGPGWNSYTMDGTFIIGLMNHVIPKQWQSPTYKYYFSDAFIGQIRKNSGCKTFDVSSTYGGNTAYLNHAEIHQVGQVIDAILAEGVDIWIQHCFNVVYYARDYPEVKYSRIESEKKMIKTIEKMIEDEIKHMRSLNLVPKDPELESVVRRDALTRVWERIPIRQVADWNYLSDAGRDYARALIKEVGTNPWEDAKPFWEWERFQPMKGEIETLFV